MKWIDIESKPEVGKEIIFGGEHPSGEWGVEIGTYTPEGCVYEYTSQREDTYYGGYLEIEIKVTHWMPLPPKP